MELLTSNKDVVKTVWSRTGFNFVTIERFHDLCTFIVKVGGAQQKETLEIVALNVA